MLSEALDPGTKEFEKKHERVIDFCSSCSLSLSLSINIYIYILYIMYSMDHLASIYICYKHTGGCVISNTYTNYVNMRRCTCTYIYVLQIQRA